MEETQQLTLDGKWVSRLQMDFSSARVTDDEMCNALRQTSLALNYVADPHTAVAIAAAQKLGYAVTAKLSSGERAAPVVIIATASPCKFQRAVTVALGKDGWNHWEDNSFPVRAQKTLQKGEKEPFHYSSIEGASLADVQSSWKQLMLDIINKHF